MAGTIPKGSIIETLPSVNRLAFGTSRDGGIIIGDMSPKQFPVEANAGTLYQNKIDGRVYRKEDNGLSTNWATVGVAGKYWEAFDSFANDVAYLTQHGVGGGSFTNSKSIDMTLADRGYLDCGDISIINSATSLTISGWMKPKNLMETNRLGTLGMLYQSGINATYGDDLGKLGATLVDGTAPTVADGWVSFNNVPSALKYEIDNFKCVNAGTIKFLFKPNYSGYPASKQYLFATSGAVDSRIWMRHGTDGKLEFWVYAGGTLNPVAKTGFSVVAGQAYLIEASFDSTYGLMISVDGEYAAVRNQFNGVRDLANQDGFVVGGYVVSNQAGDFSIAQMEVYDHSVRPASEYFESYSMSALYGQSFISKILDADHLLHIGYINGKMETTISRGSDVLRLRCDAANVNGSDWNHFAFVFDGAEAVDGDRAKVYFNGAKLSACSVYTHGSAITAMPNLTGHSLTLSKHNDTYSEIYLDEVSIYPEAMSGTDIVTLLYAGGSPSNVGVTLAGRLAHWWRMGDSAGDTTILIVDAEGNSDATVTNTLGSNPVISPEAPPAGLGIAATGSVYWNTSLEVVRAFSRGRWHNLYPIVEHVLSEEYMQDQICIDGGVLFRCLNQHISSAAPIDDPTNWELIGTEAMGDLTDVDTAGIVAGDTLEYDGAEYKPVSRAQLETELTIKELAATPTTPALGYLKVYAISKKLYILDSTGRETLLEVPMNIVDLFDGTEANIDGSTIPDKTGSPVTVVASLAADVRRVQMYDTTGLLLGWYTGASGSEALAWVSGAGTNEPTDIEIPSGTRVSVKSLTSEAGAAGQLSANFLA